MNLQPQRASSALGSLSIFLSGLTLPPNVSWAQPVRASSSKSSIAFSGMCNASAGIDLGAGLFVIADDEDKISQDHPLPLRIYDSSRPGVETSVAKIDANDLATDSSTQGELDLEGAARIEDRIYWIGSHSANKEGRERPSTQLLFSTRVQRRSGQPTIMVVGRPYRSLLRDLAVDSRYKDFDLIGASRLPSKALGGLSIESLAASPTGGLLIGLRNPLVHRTRALIVPLLNPTEVIEGGSARFGDPILLGLNGLGVRSMELLNDAYWIVAGPWGDQDSNLQFTPFQLYYWSGKPTEDPQVVPGQPFSGFLPPLQPEGLFMIDGALRILSDDGKVMINGTLCQDVKKRKNQRFRSTRIAPFSF